MSILTNSEGLKIAIHSNIQTQGKDPSRGFCQTATLAIQSIRKTVYDGWFNINNHLGNLLRKHSFTTAAAIHGMFSLEIFTLVKVIWKTGVTYTKTPKEYGFETLPENSSKTPVLLLHGAAGTWNYMGDLAKSLSNEGIPVFVIDLGSGPATDEKRNTVHAKIKEIQNIYKQAKKEAPQVDIVAHSMGGALAYVSAFDASCSSIDDAGSIQFSKNVEPKAAEGIRKIITIALPMDLAEVKQIEAIGKLDNLYNITAKYDLLVGHKTCGLETLLKEHSSQIETTHVEIVYNKEAQMATLAYLK